MSGEKNTRASCGVYGLGVLGVLVCSIINVATLWEGVFGILTFIF